jgi:hypothetical protein
VGVCSAARTRSAGRCLGLLLRRRPALVPGSHHENPNASPAIYATLTPLTDANSLRRRRRLLQLLHLIAQLLRPTLQLPLLSLTHLLRVRRFRLLHVR